MGSMWYFPQAYKLTQHNTLLMLSDSMDRNGGTGFRCVADHPAKQ
jgi:iron(II)-dependent oxidoreductase